MTSIDFTWRQFMCVYCLNPSRTLEWLRWAQQTHGTCIRLPRRNMCSRQRKNTFGEAEQLTLSMHIFLQCIYSFCAPVKPQLHYSIGTIALVEFKVLWKRLRMEDDQMKNCWRQHCFSNRWKWAWSNYISSFMFNSWTFVLENRWKKASPKQL